jgi:hypothetical protein
MVSFPIYSHELPELFKVTLDNGDNGIDDRCVSRQGLELGHPTIQTRMIPRTEYVTSAVGMMKRRYTNVEVSVYYDGLDLYPRLSVSSSLYRFG